jgi:hypothetical protein
VPRCKLQGELFPEKSLEHTLWRAYYGRVLVGIEREKHLYSYNDSLLDSVLLEASTPVEVFDLMAQVVQLSLGSGWEKSHTIPFFRVFCAKEVDHKEFLLCLVGEQEPVELARWCSQKESLRSISDVKRILRERFGRLSDLGSEYDGKRPGYSVPAGCVDVTKLGILKLCDIHDAITSRKQ